jgi:lipopolysaccharide/colanic/teichoic acid biosynthesis glycosyltransferase
MSRQIKHSLGLTIIQKRVKRSFDILMSVLGIIIFGWLIVLLIIISFFDTGENGIFIQERVGLEGKLFKIYKIRTFKKTSKNKLALTKYGQLLRSSKLDELPQLFNVLKGAMSIVGPRPDIIGFADKLSGDDRLILTVKPGITGPASIYFKNESEIINLSSNPDEYNKEVIWPKKIELNLEYIKEYSLLKDIKYLFKTIFHYT